MSMIKQDHSLPLPRSAEKAEPAATGVESRAGASDCISMAVHSFVYCVQEMMHDKAPSKAELTEQAMQQIARMGPRDAVEELLMSQMLMTHARIVFLSRFANQQVTYKWADLFTTAADRAANTYRRQMETLAKYRQPRRTRRTSITTIRTAHINAKQILTTSVQTQPSAVQPVRDRAEEKAQADSSPTAENAAADQPDQTLAQDQGPKKLPG